MRTHLYIPHLILRTHTCINCDMISGFINYIIPPFAFPDSLLTLPSPPHNLFLLFHLHICVFPLPPLSPLILPRHTHPSLTA